MEGKKMDKYTLFDNYIKGKMNDSETKNFEESLKSDKALAKEFKLYLTTVSGIIKEEEQDCIEFANAMKCIPKAELEEILNIRVMRPCASMELELENEEYVKPVASRTTILNKLKNKAFQWVAVVILFLFGAGFIYLSVYRAGRSSVNNMIVHFSSEDLKGYNSINLNEMTDEEIKNILPQLREDYYNTKVAINYSNAIVHRFHYYYYNYLMNNNIKDSISIEECIDTLKNIKLKIEDAVLIN